MSRFIFKEKKNREKSKIYTAKFSHFTILVFFGGTSFYYNIRWGKENTVEKPEAVRKIRQF